MGLRFGIIGYGGMGGWHKRHIEKLEGMEVTAIHDINPARVEAGEADGVKSYLHLQDFLSDPNIDAVIIATPNDSHMELALASAACGKHIICEKPVAMSSAQLEEMIAAAERHNVVFTVHQNRRWDKDFRKIMNVLQSGEIGEPYIIESRVHGPNGAIFGWRSKKAHGGGMMLDWGVHLIDQLLWMIKAPLKSVYCRMRRVLKLEVDDYFRVHMEFADGLMAHVEVGTMCLQPLPRWHVGGSIGTVRIETFTDEGELTILKRPAQHTNEPLVDTGAGPSRTFGKVGGVEVYRQVLEDPGTDFLDFYRNFKASVEDGAELAVKPDEVRRVMRVMEACFESDRTGMPVVFDE
ncbi:MAG: Gfo/Idh/MocA family oxidoreductase [Bacillota bacterium]|jgi:predicted dehydrogenase|nr:Gfo/Idh/MocA family oxidoreductase [Bacillota bacterium]HOB90388.1 Gfo/Idh/MocA family oxidoreductase [Bacillota bacterium]HPZ53872.1 Gfo/Idh/MocA family oxidoreductase [Bacillota bacterium]HQD17381.1 Gfo/Idh/MocA family oxidoreductase [Bacillota bacterium]